MKQNQLLSVLIKNKNNIGLGPNGVNGFYKQVAIPQSTPLNVQPKYN